MTVAELIEHLQTFPPETDVMLIDSIGPRECGTPYLHTITDEDAENCGDCEDIAGVAVVAMYAG